MPEQPNISLSGDDAELYKLLVETVRDYAIFALDPNGNIVTWNAGAQRFKGYEAHEIIGRHFSTFYSADDRAARKPEKELELATAFGRVEDEGWRIRKDGSRFWANVVITAIRDRTGRLIGFAKVTRDLSERRAAEQRAVEDARRLALAEEANRAKSEFLASMSHELRTPLNAIGGYTDLLLAGVGGAIAPTQESYLQRIRRSQQHLLGIINDLLNFSRIEAGRLEYEMRSADVSLAIQDVVMMLEPQAKARGLSLSANVAGELCAWVDRSKVDQILLNLISNAIKFTERDGTIDVRATQDASNIIITVADTGIGIPEDKLHAVFEPFVQVGRSLTTAHEGTGLGLAISRDLARAMGGDLTVRSTVDAGSTFELLLKKA